MKSIEFEDWDGGKLRVNRDFAPLLRANGLDTFENLMNYSGGTVAKNLLAERTTTRIALSDGTHGRAFYIKRHTPSPFKEYIKPLLRLTWPILGARNEWNALLHFHDAQIPTMTPVALGESGRMSFLLTEAIEGYTKLSDWFGEEQKPHEVERVLNLVAQLAHKMHRAGLHHQDFYLGHLLLHKTNDGFDIRVIDLGRARFTKHLAGRWIVKDLAQLNYSARDVSVWNGKQFLRDYFGRRHRLDPAEEILTRRIEAKSRRIARHSQKNRL